MSEQVNKFSIKRLVATLDPERPYSTAELANYGLRASHAAHLAKSGWLKRLGRGVYQLQGGQLERDKSLIFLSAQVPGLHVGGKTALAWRGVRHQLAVRERLTLWGDSPVRLPLWFKEAFNVTYQTTQLFDAALPAGYGLSSLPTGDAQLRVSVPERALLELFSDAGKRQSLSETMQVAEGVRNLRPDILEVLLQHCQRVKAVRLAKAFAEKYEQPWLGLVTKHSERLGSSSRWVATMPNNELLSLKR